RFAHASLDQMRHAKFLPDLLRRRVLTFEGKCRSPCGDVQPGNFLEHRQQFFTDSVGKIFAAFVVAEIREREHGHGLIGNWHGSYWRRGRLGPKKIEGKQASCDYG